MPSGVLVRVRFDKSTTASKIVFSFLPHTHHVIIVVAATAYLLIWYTLAARPASQCFWLDLDERTVTRSGSARRLLSPALRG